jgi:prepilin-type N-terminal cleavage/methylation domain-containing protein
MTAPGTHIMNRIRPHHRSAGGFTLTELLVVISIIVLLLALAVPLFNVLRGGRSVDAGQNIMSSMLQRARARAIGIQERRGVFFFDDQITGKTGMLLVRLLPTPDAVTLELDDDQVEAEYLPNGIGAAFLLPSITGPDYHPCGLIVFDGIGRIETVPKYMLKSGIPGGTYLEQQYTKNIGAAGSSHDVMGKLGISAVEMSQAAFVLYDRRGISDQPPAPTDPAINFGPEQRDWLDRNAVAVVMNRYNGTLIRGE